MKKIKKNLKLITIIVVMIIATSVFFLKWNLKRNEREDVVVDEMSIEKQESSEQITTEEVSLKNVFVDIKGAVLNPGVYEITEDKKVIDVVQLAGGLKENADTSMINLAKKVTNEMVIIIYTTDEVKDSKKDNSIIKIIEKECVYPEINNDACLKQENTLNDISEKEEDILDKKVNINSATLDELTAISGIGESKAESIIEYRNEFGKFEKIEDIMKVTGIGEALYEKIKNDITV